MNVLQLLTPNNKQKLKDRFPEMWQTFEGNPPSLIADYVIGMTDGKYRVEQCNEHGYSISFPQEGNREIAGMSSMNVGRSLSESLFGIIWFLWARKEIIAKKRKAVAINS